MFVQPELILELNCSDFFCTYCMLLSEWSPSNVFSFILYHRWFTVRRRSFWYPGYTTGNTAPHERSRTGKSGIVWRATLLSNYSGAWSSDPSIPVRAQLVPSVTEKRPVPSYLGPLFQNESKGETFHVKMSSACSFIFMQIKLTFIRNVLL